MVGGGGGAQGLRLENQQVQGGGSETGVLERADPH